MFIEVMLQDLSLSVMGILNDATGTLMSCAHKEPTCRIGIIIGELTMISALYTWLKAWLLQPKWEPDRGFPSNLSQLS